MKDNILSKKRLCIGCGICSTVCPKQCISFTQNIIGHYEPSINTQECVNCGLCLNNCPIDRKAIEFPKALYYDKIIGGYEKSYIGWDSKFRRTSASGGLLTSFLYYILSKKIVDTVVCINPQKNKSGYYKYSFVKSPEDLIQKSKSVYYPMQVSEALNFIKANEGNYAIVVLPCQAKGIRLLQKRDRILRERIKILAGLVCGNLPGTALVEYVRRTMQINGDQVSKIVFRKKDDFHKVSDYALSFVDENNKVLASSYLSDSFGFAFLNKLFSNRACNVCHDIFAEYADIVFMDAWLDKYKDQKLGTSICVTRSHDVTSIAQSCFEQIASVEECPVEIAIKAQEQVALVLKKKTENRVNRYIYRCLGYDIDCSRINIPFRLLLKSLIKDIQLLLIQNRAEKLWKRVIGNEISVESFNIKMRKFVRIVKVKK